MEETNEIVRLVQIDIDKLKEELSQKNSEIKSIKSELSRKHKIRSLASGEKLVKKKYKKKETE